MQEVNQAELSALLTRGNMRIHLVGVAGSGMSGIAALLLELGQSVSGCDRVTTVEVERLQRLGLAFHSIQDGSYLDGVDLVIYSSAIRNGNRTYDEAVRRNLPMIRRAEALAAIMAAKGGVVIAGMHGKTTTSAMASHVLRVGGLKPSHYVGAEIPILGTNAHWDPAGEIFVAEGDESDGTLVLYTPQHTVLLNVEPEHLDFYRDLSEIERVYNTLLDQTSGAIFYCIDDPGAASLCSNRPGAISFGAAENARYRFTNVRPKGFSAEFSVYREDALLGQVTLGVPGQHNVSNATGVIALATELGVEFSRIQEALSSFRGARRRFEVKYASPNYLVLDDYAHHPTEIRMTLATARAGASGRVKAMFQPHRYSRTKALQKEFGGSFGDADAVFVTDVYPASEPPIEGVTGELIANAITAAGHPSVTYEPDIAKLHFAVGNRLQPGDTLISLGAGNIHEASALIGRDLQVLDRLREAMGSGVAKLYEPMARHTTLRIGGPAQYWLEPETEEGFARIVRLCRSERLPLMVVGRGSNLLVRDGGIRGVVVHPERGEFGKIKISGTEIEVGVGVKFRQISAAAKNAGIGGFEWMEGIPGNAGGGIRMNAGAMGSQTFDQVIEVRYLDSAGLIHTARPDELDVQYRNVPYFKDHYALSVRLRGYRSDPGEIAKRIDAALDKRKTTQPAAASAGCIFKNPAECPAGKLVDELGMKDFTVGGARVSGVHANFVVNDGGAKCADVITIIETIRGLARKDRGINLETEVQIVGEENPY